jgi:hypothetical protein
LKGERIVGELGGQLENRTALKIWRLASLCLMRCLWRERNARSFEDLGNGLLKLKKLMSQFLYTWRVAWNSLPVFNFSKFLEFCSFSIL